MLFDQVCCFLGMCLALPLNYACRFSCPHSKEPLRWGAAGVLGAQQAGKGKQQQSVTAAAAAATGAAAAVGGGGSSGGGSDSRGAGAAAPAAASAAQH